MAATEIQLEDVELERAVASLTARRRRGTNILYSILGALAFIGFWSFFSVFVYPPYVLPAPWSVAERMWELVVSGEVFSNFLASFLKTMLGWVLALGMGIPIVTLVTNVTAYKRLSESGATSWDSDGGFTVNHRKIGIWRLLVLLAFFCGFIALVILGEESSGKI